MPSGTHPQVTVNGCVPCAVPSVALRVFVHPSTSRLLAAGAHPRVRAFRRPAALWRYLPHQSSSERAAFYVWSRDCEDFARATACIRPVTSERTGGQFA